MQRLNPALLDELKSIRQPNYPRDELRPGIVHLGIGAFHRAHQAFYTEQVLNEGGGDWGIIGCSLRSDQVREQLAPQDGLYTLLQRGTTNDRQIIGVVQKVLVGPEDPQAIIDAIAEESIKVVSLTVTEKGYCHHPATGALNQDHPDIQHDLSHPLFPKSAVGYIVAGLERRRRDGRPGVTLLSCDNLPNNGRVLQAVITDFAQRSNPGLIAWIAQNVRFPCTMVDRIVPATTPEDIQCLEREYGYTDEAMVVAEPFSQWVIENDFAASRPPWEKVGALLVADVAPYENLKLRLLNGSHSALAYTGYLAGCNTIYQVMQNPTLAALCQRFMGLAASTLGAPEGFDIDAYQADLVERFANPGLAHRTWQIAMDGSQKLPQRWLDTLRDLLKQGEDTRLLSLAIAAWMRYISGENEDGNAIEVVDPMHDVFVQISQKHGVDRAAYVQALFHLKPIFGEDLASNKRLTSEVTELLKSIDECGVLTTAERVLLEPIHQ